jgi:S-(hydroxymethyl)glutathione dehydrogenase / alcohol dehydrogenase
MRQIRAAVCRDFGMPLTIETLHLAPPGPGEVQVDVDAVAICHSDISYAAGDWGGPLPAVYGHEAAGRVAAVGPGITAYAPGDRVLVTLIRSCGACPSCTSGHPVRCEGHCAPDHPLTDGGGQPVWQAMATGAFAEAVTVHHSQIAPVPETMPADAACLLACGVITGFGAVMNTARVRPGSNVVVIGAGGVGLNCVQAAAIAGARRIVAVDLSEAKLADAETFGATDGVLANADRPWRAVRALTGGRGADYVFVTVGAIPAYEAAPRYLAPGGVVVMTGMPASGALATYEPVIFAAAGQAMIGSKMGDTVLKRDLPALIDWHARGRLKLAELISGRYPLDRINDAIASSKAGVARRNVIVMGDAS